MSKSMRRATLAAKSVIEASRAVGEVKALMRKRFPDKQAEKSLESLRDDDEAFSRLMGELYDDLSPQTRKLFSRDGFITTTLKSKRMLMPRRAQKAA